MVFHKRASGSCPLPVRNTEKYVFTKGIRLEIGLEYLTLKHKVLSKKLNQSEHKLLKP